MSMALSNVVRVGLRPATLVGQPAARDQRVTRTVSSEPREIVRSK